LLLGERGVTDDVIFFGLFEETRAGIDCRYPLSLAWPYLRTAGPV